MRLKNKKTLFHHLIPLFLLFFLAIPVYAQHGLTKTADASTLSTYNQDVPTMLGTVIGAAMSLVGVVFFVLSIYAGFLWMTARGDETQAKKARDTLTMSVIGLIIVFSAYAITAFIFASDVSKDCSSHKTQAACEKNALACDWHDGEGQYEGLPVKCVPAASVDQFDRDIDL